MVNPQDIPQPKRAARIAVYWRDDWKEIVLIPRNWQKVRNGESLSIRGKGYYYNDKFFWDYWSFSGGLDGEVTVGYGGSAAGFKGKLSKAVIKEFEYIPARRRVNTGSLKVGKVIRRSGGFTIREASPDDPIYKRGFVIGGRILRKSTKDTKKQPPLPGKRNKIMAWLEEGIYGAAQHQMSGSEEQGLSNSQGKKDSGS